MPTLAINGGTPITSEPFPSQLDLDFSAMEKIMETVLSNELLTGYQANAANFYGGPCIKALERAFEKMFGSGSAIACNSCTSALQIACMAIGLEPGDEVIVSPYSMTCSATAPLICGATPVFADVEKDYYCLDPASIEKVITDKTKAIIVVDLFGQPHDVDHIKAIAKKHGLFIIEDAAQAIGSKCYKKYAGTFGDIGCFSFNQGKHISVGEGGMIVTDNDELAVKCRLLMNHAESVINEWNDVDNVNLNLLDEIKHMWGFNMRMTEITAAIALNQLEQFEYHMDRRMMNVRYLNGALSEIPAITPSPIRPFCTHTHYVQSFTWDDQFGIHRDKFINAVKAELMPISGRESEGVPIGNGYIKPLYRFPIFEDNSKYHYDRFPVVEKLWKDDLFLMRFHAPPTEIKHAKLVSDAFFKVWEYRSEL